jgi:hypothetical protein
VLAAGLPVRLEILGENPSPVRGGADREAARVRIVVGDEDDEGEADLTILRVVVSGRRSAEAKRFQWDLVDRYDSATGLRSMSRTTVPSAMNSGL